jgi:hypothetical protein
LQLSRRIVCADADITSSINGQTVDAVSPDSQLVITERTQCEPVNRVGVPDESLDAVRAADGEIPLACGEITEAESHRSIHYLELIVTRDQHIR